jgi:hypothetical protein
MMRVSTCAIVLALLAGACSSGGGSSSRTTATTIAPLEVAGPTPSESASMICEAEVKEEIAASTGVDAVRVTKPAWNVAQHVLTCDYDYAAGAKMNLAVKEMSSEAETTAYYEAQAKRLGRTNTFKIAQGAFRTSNGSLVVRKDYKVLVIDVSHLPAKFGPPPGDRASAAVGIASVIMECWTGT